MLTLSTSRLPWRRKAGPETQRNSEALSRKTAGGLTVCNDSITSGLPVIREEPVGMGSQVPSAKPTSHQIGDLVSITANTDGRISVP